ncbi:GAF domain-containing protein [Pseudahrensia aquimaris]|uniref:GAF domain-containing protein n=1 Tax=Pseudahrensia aquimaris TaxID=744461 RepID=A0ABW3FGW5_9HYPH
MKASGLTDVIVELLKDANRRRVKTSVENITADQDKKLQAIASKAGEIFECPISQVTLLGDQFQTFLVSQGADLSKAPTETSFCAHTLGAEDPVFIVCDATKDERFKSNPFVTGDFHIRFYIGCPIILEDQRIGTICLYDFTAREGITREQSRLLVDLAWDASLVLSRG